MTFWKILHLKSPTKHGVPNKYKTERKTKMPLFNKKATGVTLYYTTLYDSSCSVGARKIWNSLASCQNISSTACQNILADNQDSFKPLLGTFIPNFPDKPLVKGGGGGGVHPDYFVKLDFEIAVDQQTRARDRTFEGVLDSG